MEVSGWRLKGCGELKRGLKNYQQGRASIRVTLPSMTHPRAEQDGEEWGIKRETKRGMKLGYGEAV